MNPQSRRDQLLAQNVGDELVIYDERTHEAHRLSRTAAFVWQTADGSRDVPDVAARLRESLPPDDPSVEAIDDAASESLVLLALQELDRTGLLAQKLHGLGESISRREMIGVAATLLPVIASIVAPAPAMAQTLNQATCTYIVGPAPPPVSGNGGTAAVSVTTLFAGCRWTATVTAMSPPSPTFISGGGTVTGTGSTTFTLQPNTTGQPRTATVRVSFPAGNPQPPQDITIRQDPVLGTGLIQVTLHWDTATDIDLHVIEPDLTHVFYNHKVGTTAQLDTDNTAGFGPENIFVQTPAAGVYQFYIVHFSGPVATTSTIDVKVPGQTRTFQRLTTSPSSGVGYNVANVNIGPPATITETSGTRASDDRSGTLRKPT